MQKEHKTMNSESIAKTVLNLKINGDHEIQCELKRHLSPRTIRAILALVPFKSSAIILTKVIGLQTPVAGRIERPRKEFKRGDIAFFPAEGKLYFFKEESVTKRPMTPLGTILSGSEELDKTKPDDTLLFYRVS